jgi:hypothetical protein
MRKVVLAVGMVALGSMVGLMLAAGILVVLVMAGGLA